MRRAFLSYRRDDTQFITSTLYHQLEEPSAFGPASVFMDIDDIPPGVDFRDVIDEAVSKCEFFLAVIGRRWVSARLMDPNDFVRLEIEAALRRNIPVTPLLVDGATMPKPEELPDTLHPLLFKNGVTIRHGKDFKPDVLRLVEGLQKAAEWYRRRAEGSDLATRVRKPSVETEQTGGLDKTIRELQRRTALTIIRSKHTPLAEPIRKAGERHEITIPGGVPMTFAWCPPGTFLMGSPDSEKDRGSDEWQHTVWLTRGFWMGIHPVTQAQWRAVMGTDPSHFKGDTLPVEQVSWDDTQAFCETLKQGGVGLRLPLEAEWEYAARGGTTTPFYWGDALDGTQANCDGNDPYGTGQTNPPTYLQKTTPVGSYAARFPHPWGLWDVIGNVLEWCADCYDEAFHGTPEATKPTSKPLYSNQKSRRVLRGGSWYSSARQCRAAARDDFEPAGRGQYYGFRLRLD